MLRRAFEHDFDVDFEPELERRSTLNSRQRLAAAMRHEPTDRTPVMCQLAIGHYFLYSGLDPVEIWHDTSTFVEALLRLQQRYGFDGVLVNLSGRDPDWRSRVDRIERDADGARVVWDDGRITQVPPDDNPHVYQPDGRTRFFPTFAELDPKVLWYVDPHDISGVTYPWVWGFADEPADPADFFPAWQDAAVRLARERAPGVSVHGEVFSPFSQLMELLDFEQALIALIDDPGKVEACLARLAQGGAQLMGILALAGADAILISSAFAGAGFISPDHYRRFVLPYELGMIEAFRASFPALPVYTHTCGAIGDRLELLEATGTNGIDTLDPPPLGDVELGDAKRRIGGRLFIKGNMDPVNTLLAGPPERVRADALARIAVAAPGGGYILSTACSVPPATPPAHVEQLCCAADIADGGEAGMVRG
jgi:uroporphyrinogen-III decarboxylase